MFLLDRIDLLSIDHLQIGVTLTLVVTCWVPRSCTVTCCFPSKGWVVAGNRAWPFMRCHQLKLFSKCPLVVCNICQSTHCFAWFYAGLYSSCLECGSWSAKCIQGWCCGQAGVEYFYYCIYSPAHPRQVLVYCTITTHSDVGSFADNLCRTLCKVSDIVCFGGDLKQRSWTLWWATMHTTVWNSLVYCDYFWNFWHQLHGWLFWLSVMFTPGATLKVWSKTSRIGLGKVGRIHTCMLRQWFCT